ncbi:hypothetical protein G6N05_05240 [Flavobacterium sp. F372]|uniref:Uncharacterized protein n=1 Tax=Flavobacterium bernardetii TaxID=2813823 RepID=A0ABR7J164_9FLAO|nr:hypothetical protein [Flavobacterium bernardetii]MBC5835784.1 hypothetical protein [Flavobacterium bernardetii]NHF69515.1 hypothetical protein [Flavobacterium bernardetii]
MSGLTYKPVKIEITYSNSETRKLGINEGDVFDAEQEFLNGKPKLSFYFTKDGKRCVAYDVKHDEEAMIMVTTCKIYFEHKVDKNLESDLNRVKAQLKQLNESELFSKEERERLTPIYQNQIDDLNTKIIKKFWNDNGRKLGWDETNKVFNYSDITIGVGLSIEVKDAEILSNNQPGE